MRNLDESIVDQAMTRIMNFGDGIEVYSHNGYVLVVGTADARNKERINNVLRKNVRGIRRLYNEIFSENFSGQYDRSIAENVRRAIGHLNRVVQVVVSNKHVYLMGMVSEGEEYEASLAASYVPNVSKVVRLFELENLPDGNASKQAPAPESAKPFAENTDIQLVGTGTGFVVNGTGNVVTNAHVVADCSQLQVVHAGKSYEASRQSFDRQNDLALLTSTFRSESQGLNIDTAVAGRLGEDIVAVGYPLYGVLSTSLKVTTGNISATAGLEDDSRYYQISAPIQPGNSGGPLFNKRGSIIGIVSAKLDDLWSIKSFGTLPQNVNFAIKSSVLEVFLRASSIEFNHRSDTQSDLATPDIAELAKDSTVQILCWR